MSSATSPGGVLGFQECVRGVNSYMKTQLGSDSAVRVKMVAGGRSEEDRKMKKNRRKYLQ